MTDYADLKQKAEAATPGEWQHFTEHRWGRNVGFYVWTDKGPGFGSVTQCQPSNHYTDEIARRNADAAYIAAANPARILALIDTLEAQQARIAELEAALTRIRSRALGWIDSTDFEGPSRFSLMAYDIDVANEVLDDKGEQANASHA